MENESENENLTLSRMKFKRDCIIRLKGNKRDLIRLFEVGLSMPFAYRPTSIISFQQKQPKAQEGIFKGSTP
jgi:hypothetical protein